MKPGSVIVDLAAEAGGNVATTVPGQIVTVHDVVHIGLTDLPSRLPAQSSTLYANNISKFLLSMGDAKQQLFEIRPEDEVVRGSMVLRDGELMWPPPVVAVSAAQPAAKTAVISKAVAEVPNPFNEVLKASVTYTAGLSGMLALGYASPGPEFTTMMTTLGLAGIVGYHTVWGVTPALHSPLMSVTNAISGITAVGGLLLMGGGLLPSTVPETLAASAALISFVNIFGGFQVVYIRSYICGSPILIVFHFRSHNACWTCSDGPPIRPHTVPYTACQPPCSSAATATRRWPRICPRYIRWHTWRQACAASERWPDCRRKKPPGWATRWA